MTSIKSQGGLFEAIYAGEVVTPGVTLYPQIGAEYLRRSMSATTTAFPPRRQARANTAPINRAAHSNPFVAVLADHKNTEEVHLNFYLRPQMAGQPIRVAPLSEARAWTPQLLRSLSLQVVRPRAVNKTA